MLNIAMIQPAQVVLFICTVLIMAVMLYVDRKDVILKSALYIVAKVEEEWGSSMGQVKFAEAYTYIKSKYPIVTFFLPQSLMKQIIEDALVDLKKILATKELKDSAHDAFVGLKKNLATKELKDSAHIEITE